MQRGRVFLKNEQKKVTSCWQHVRQLLLVSIYSDWLLTVYRMRVCDGVENVSTSKEKSAMLQPSQTSDDASLYRTTTNWLNEVKLPQTRTKKSGLLWNLYDVIKWNSDWISIQPVHSSTDWIPNVTTMHNFQRNWRELITKCYVQENPNDFPGFMMLPVVFFCLCLSLALSICISFAL